MPRKIVIDITDWEEEYFREEASVSTLAEILDSAQGDRTAPEIARLVIVGRARGEVDSDIIPPNKNLLQNGGTLAVDLVSESRIRNTEMTNVKKYTVREFIGPMPDEGEESSGKPYMAVVETQEAADRAETYLLKRIPGHIARMLMQLREAGKDVAGPAEELKAKIDGMVNDMQPSSG